MNNAVLDELRAHGGLIEMNLSILGHVIYLGYNEAEDYRPDYFGKFRVRWLINNELYFFDTNSKYIKFIKAEDWDWDKAEPGIEWRKILDKALLGK